MHILNRHAKHRIAFTMFTKVNSMLKGIPTAICMEPVKITDPEEVTTYIRRNFVGFYPPNHMEDALVDLLEMSRYADVTGIGSTACDICIDAITEFHSR